MHKKSMTRGMEVHDLHKLLLLEDDISLIDGLTYGLERQGFDIVVARTIKEAEKLVEGSTGFDLLLFDVTLPDGNGFTLCERLRRSGSQVPIIFLTTSDQEISIVKGLDMGGDDYITKPFKLNELLSRIKALLRRSAGFSQSVFLEANGIKVDLMERLVWKNGVLLDLPLVEYKLLCLLMRNPNHLLTRETILDSLWDGAGNYVDDNTLSVYVRRLRNKIEETPNAPQHLLTERGIGYKWVVE